MKYRGLALWLVALAACTDHSRAPATAHWVRAANQALQSGHYHTALVYTDSVLALDARSADAFFLQGRVFFELGQWNRARNAYEEVLALEPDYPGVHHNLGNTFFSQRQFQQARHQFDLAARDQNVPNSWHALGAAYAELGMLDSAFFAFRQAVALDSLYAPAHASLAEWLEQAGRFEEALLHAEQAEELGSDDRATQVRRGRLLMRAGRLDEATAVFSQVASAHPYDVESRYALGQAMTLAGAVSEARPVLAAAESLRAIDQHVSRLASAARDQPTNFEAQVVLAQALRNSRRLGEAEHTYRVARALRPYNLDLWYHMATLDQQRGRVAEAEQALLQIVGTDSTYVLGWVSLSYHYAQAGKFELALSAWETAVRVDPDHAAVQAQIAPKGTRLQSIER